MKKEEIKKLIPDISEEQLNKLYEAFLTSFEDGKKAAFDEAQKQEFSKMLDEELKEASVKSIKAVKALLDMDKISFENGKITGLSEQLEMLKKECGYLFEKGSKKPEFTVASSDGKQSKKDFENMNYTKRLKLFSENPELYKQLLN